MIFAPQESSILSDAMKPKPKVRKVSVRKVATREERVALKKQKRSEFIEIFKKMGI